MIKHSILLLATLILGAALTAKAEGISSGDPETVAVHNGSVTLHALIWRPQGRGPFPAILLNHGSGRTPEDLKRLGPYEAQAYILGPMFARHGYVFMFLFRRGVGLSTDQGKNAIDLMNTESEAHGMPSRNKLQLDLLENRDMGDALSGLAYLRTLPGVDAHEVAAIGHSFGGSLTVLMAEREPELRAIVIFSGAGYSWDRSAELRTKLLVAIENSRMPFFFIHAENDIALSSGKAMDAKLQQLGRPHQLKIYPPIGHTTEDGHAFLFLGANIWESDVFAFLDKYMRK